LPLGTD